MASVLVVDDEPLFRDYLRTVLEREGHCVCEAGNGEQGAKEIERADLDLVITDIVMPKKDGIELILDIGKERPDLGIIAVSGGGWPSGCFLIPAKALGADAILSKPFSKADLIDAVNEVLNRVALN